MNPFVSSLTRRAFGAGNSVVVLGQNVDDGLPVTDAPAAVKEALEKLFRALHGETASYGEIVFLVGGPGNGKSHQAESLLNKLNLDQVALNPNLAYRARSFDMAVGTFLVVNDATIREKSSREPGPGDLALDIRAIRDGSVKNALICVNRGILVEELSRLHRIEDGWREEIKLLQWLMQYHEAVNPENHSLAGPAGGYYQHCEISGAKLNVRALFLDQLSMLEAQPKVEMASEIKTMPYRVSTPGSLSRLKSPAAGLLAQIVKKENFEDASACAGCEVRDLCPILANAQNLRQEHVLKSVIELLRGAEFASGQLFTYRDLWAIFALLVTGPESVSDYQSDPCQRVITAIASFKDQPAEKRQEEALRLSRMRFYDSLFDVKEPLGSGSQGDDMALGSAIKRVRQLDPVLDATLLWASPVGDAMQAVVFDKFPLDYLVAHHQEVEAVVKPIDEMISREMLSALYSDGAQVNDLQRRRILQCCGRSLYRLFGLCKGKYAKQYVVEEWLWARSSVVGVTTELAPQTPLEQALQYLVMPPSEFDRNRCFFPLLQPRVSPVVAALDEPIWCKGFKVNGSLIWEFFDRGDALWARLKLQGQPNYLTEFHIDFALCKEALASVVFGSRDIEFSYGFTDEGNAVSPRIERVRASFISRAAMQMPAASTVNIVGSRSLSLPISEGQ